MVDSHFSEHFSPEPNSHKRAGEELPVPASKRGKNADELEEGQMTIDEMFEVTANGEDMHMDEVSNTSNGGEHNAGSAQEEALKSRTEEDEEDLEKNPSDTKDADTTTNHPLPTPPSVLEKGLIYFLYRSRVNVFSPHGISDIARTYIVLHPLPSNTHLAAGQPIPEIGNSRLLALPKKTLPRTGDKFLAFVEKASKTIEELREVLGGADVTGTGGTSHIPPATPFAEGVYAITTTSPSPNSITRNTHLAYHLTVPISPESSPVQQEFGLCKKGSYALSLKNPVAPSPANSTLDNPARYTKEIMDMFRGRRWMPVVPEALDFEGAQALLIGEGMGDISMAGEGAEEMIVEFEAEDHERVKALDEDDPVFADLALSAQEFSHLTTTWENSCP